MLEVSVLGRGKTSGLGLNTARAFSELSVHLRVKAQQALVCEVHQSGSASEEHAVLELLNEFCLGQLGKQAPQPESPYDGSELVLSVAKGDQRWEPSLLIGRISASLSQRNRLADLGGGP